MVTTNARVAEALNDYRRYLDKQDRAAAERAVTALLPLAEAVADQYKKNPYGRYREDIYSEAACCLTLLIFGGKLEPTPTRFNDKYLTSAMRNAGWDFLRRRRREEDRETPLAAEDLLEAPAVSWMELRRHMRSRQYEWRYENENRFFIEHERDAMLRKRVLADVRLSGVDRSVVAYILDCYLNNTPPRPFYLRDSESPVSFLLGYTKFLIRKHLRELYDDVRQTH